jgi:O-antigen ligase
MGIYLSFSRGALAALAAGLVVLTVLAPTWPQLRSTLVAVGGGTLAAFTASRFDGVQSLAGNLAHRERQGAIALVILVVLVVVAAGFQTWASRAERAGRLRPGAIPLPRRTPAIAAALVVLIAAGVAFAAARESRSGGAPPRGANAARLGSLQSHRYEYWKVAVRTFAHHPVIGVGASGFAVEWLRHRPFREPAQDAHSLYLETAAELGLVGLAALALLLAGIALAARDAWRRDPVLAAGACAALTAWALHAGLDWDWEMPGLTLVAIVLAGLLIAAADDGDNERSP